MLITKDRVVVFTFCATVDSECSSFSQCQSSINKILSPSLDRPDRQKKKRWSYVTDWLDLTKKSRAESNVAMSSRRHFPALLEEPMNSSSSDFDGSMSLRERRVNAQSSVIRFPLSLDEHWIDRRFLVLLSILADWSGRWIEVQLDWSFFIIGLSSSLRVCFIFRADLFLVVVLHATSLSSRFDLTKRLVRVFIRCSLSAEQIKICHSLCSVGKCQVFRKNISSWLHLWRLFYIVQDVCNDTTLEIFWRRTGENAHSLLSNQV